MRVLDAAAGGGGLALHPRRRRRSRSDHLLQLQVMIADVTRHTTVCGGNTGRKEFIPVGQHISSVGFESFRFKCRLGWWCAIAAQLKERKFRRKTKSCSRVTTGMDCLYVLWGNFFGNIHVTMHSIFLTGYRTCDDEEDNV